LSTPNKSLAYVKRRKGFIRLALKYGLPVVPCWCFGENELFHTSSFALGIRKSIVKTFGVAIVFAFGRSVLLPFMPKPGVKLVQVVGKPIQVPRKEDFDETDVQKYLGLYIQGLRDVFDANKAKYGRKDDELIIV